MTEKEWKVLYKKLLDDKEKDCSEKDFLVNLEKEWLTNLDSKQYNDEEVESIKKHLKNQKNEEQDNRITEYQKTLISEFHDGTLSSEQIYFCDFCGGKLKPNEVARTWSGGDHVVCYYCDEDEDCF